MNSVKFQRRDSMKKLFSKGVTDMTHGNILNHLVSFAMPLLLGFIFQQLYNTVDTWVVGNYVSNEAFSAVGSVGPIINTLIGFFTGLATGAGVVISQYFGAKKMDKVKESVHTSIFITLILSVVFTAVGILIIPYALDLMKTPVKVIPESTTYLTIYFGGVTGLLFYNMGSGILRAVGDSRKPFYYLLASALINTVLDLVFVLVFDMGVDGVAWATIIAQFISAILVMIELMTTKTCVHFSLKDMKIKWDILGKIIKVGIPTGLQMAITAFSNIFVQSYINHFGPDFMSGWTAYAKIDQLVLLPVQSLSLAATTFVGQNLGIQDVPRAKKGLNIAFMLSLVCTLVIMIPVMIFAPQLTSFFNAKPEVVTHGAYLLRIISPFYLCICVNQIYAGALRGAGVTRVPVAIMLFSFVVFRQIYLFVMSRYVANTVTVIALAYPAGWVLAAVLTLIYYKKANLSSAKIV